MLHTTYVLKITVNSFLCSIEIRIKYVWVLRVVCKLPNNFCHQHWPSNRPRLTHFWQEDTGTNVALLLPNDSSQEHGLVWFAIDQKPFPSYVSTPLAATENWFIFVVFFGVRVCHLVNTLCSFFFVNTILIAF